MLDFKVMAAIEETGSRNEKIALLCRLPDEAKTFFRLALDPTITFGVTCDVDEMVSRWHAAPRSPYTDESWWADLFLLLEDLSFRRLIGLAAIRAMESCLLSAPEVSCVIWGARAINKDLRCGVSVSTANKVWPGLIDDLSVTLALPYDPAKHEIRGTWWVTPKLDGYRMTIIDGVPYSRNKRVYTTVDHVLKEIGAPFLETYVWDGEIMGPADDFDEAGGKIRRKGEQASEAVFHVFDLVKRGQWLKDTDAYNVRYVELQHVVRTLKNTEIGADHIRIVPGNVLVDPTPEDLFKEMKSCLRQGYEGAMLRCVDDPYFYERTDRLLKLKDFVSADLPIVGFYEGRGKHKGRLGGVVVEMDGVLTKVGSGFTDEQRTKLWTQRDDLGGKYVEVQYQNKTKDGALRFPVFMCFRPDKG